MNTLDLSSFFELRDAVAILLIYETGMRNYTFAQIRESHIDFSNKLFVLPPAIMKVRRSVVLPLSDNLGTLIKDLIDVNNRIRKTYNQVNDYVFINRLGRTIHQTGHSNVIQKRLIEIEKKTGIKNLSPHSLRRAYATNLYRKVANIPIISKALGHSDFSITHKYLYLDKNEVDEELRKYNEL